MVDSKLLKFNLLRSILKPALGYGLGNLLNTVAMILLLPVFVYLNDTNGKLSAQGILIAQVASIFASYTFSLTIPRTLESLKLELKQFLFFELFAFQILIGIFGLCAIFLIQKNLALPEFCGYIIAYSAVLQWQWLHVTNKKSRLQADLLIATRSFVIILEIYILSGVEQSSADNWLFYPLITTMFCITVFPTLLVLNFKEIAKPTLNARLGMLIMTEFKKGHHLFSASLLTSIYSLGPSIIVSYFNPSLLILIQQFDRIRLALSNISAMLLGVVYPILIGVSQRHLITGFKGLQKYVLIPILILSLTIFLSIPFFSKGVILILSKLQMTNISLVFALIAGCFAASSNAISLTFLHPLVSDRFYLSTIFKGALIFLLSSLLSIIFFPLSSIGLCLMISVVFVELAINVLLWSRSIKLLSE
jgi:predicted small integral membrane protein